MAVADINAAGGVLGQQLVLSIGDDACDPKQVVRWQTKWSAMAWFHSRPSLGLVDPGLGGLYRRRHPADLAGDPQLEIHGRGRRERVRVRP